jgi:hypothetical protein
VELKLLAHNRMAQLDLLQRHSRTKVDLQSFMGLHLAQKRGLEAADSASAVGLRLVQGQVCGLQQVAGAVTVKASFGYSNTGIDRNDMPTDDIGSADKFMASFRKLLRCAGMLENDRKTVAADAGNQ